MVKQYVKQALYQFRENPLISGLSVAGTALAIAVVLVLVLVFQINTAGFAPESNRSRLLYVFTARVQSNNGGNSGGFSAEVLRECFYPLQIPEAVCGYARGSHSLSLPTKRLYKPYEVCGTDQNYWRIFDHTFVEGVPFTEADVQSGIRNAVLSEQTARDLFGNESAVGKEVWIDMQPCRVCGVAKEVPNPLMVSYGQVWMPYSCFPEWVTPMSYAENMSGAYSACLLARSPQDFDAIQDELLQQVERYGSTKRDATLSFPAGCLTQIDTAMGSHGFKKVQWTEFMADQGSLLLLLLLVPALNLIALVQSSLQKRVEETGLRRAFGATRSDVVWQVLSENFVMTLIGAAIGILLSLGLIYVAKSFLLNSGIQLTLPMLIRPGLFLAAFLLALLLNILSAMLPAWRVMRHPIVEALHGSESEKK